VSVSDGSMETRNGASAIGLTVSAPETESLIWPPTMADGTTIWLVKEPVSDAPVPDTLARGHESIGTFDAPVTIEIASFQSVADLWELDTTDDPIPALLRGAGEENSGGIASADARPPTVETVPAPAAFDIPPGKSADRNYGRWALAAAVSTVIALGGLWTRHERQLGMESMAVAAPPTSTEGPPQDRANIRPEAPPLVSLPAPSDRTPIVAPVRHAVEDLQPVSRAEIRTAAPRPSNTRDAAVPTAVPPSIGTTTNRPSSQAAFSPRFDTAAVPAATVAPVTVDPPAPLPATAAPTLAVQPSYLPRPDGPDPTVVRPKPQVDDQLLVNQALQRYRVAYDELDAQSAQAVWPSVNQAALARAFEALESQTLSFETCDIQLQTGGTATATCRGSARYVPKIGNRDTHTESRVWSFNLRKEGTAWTIDRALVAR
jgi:hypothetical protein